MCNLMLQLIVLILIFQYISSLCNDGSNWSPEELEDLLSKLGSTGDRWSMLDSTAHNVFRLLLRNNHTDSLFRIMTQPQDYATFLDHHVANLLMDHYLDQHDYTRECQPALLFSQHNPAMPLVELKVTWFNSTFGCVL